MAIRNSYSVYIGGINYTNGAVMPLKGAQFLDEQLDELMISLRGIKKASFPPLTPVEITVTNELWWKQYGDGKTRSKTYYMVVAEDTATEKPAGNPYGYYDHELYCIEVTKAAERVIVDSLTYTNDLGRAYTNNAQWVVPDFSETQLGVA